MHTTLPGALGMTPSWLSQNRLVPTFLRTWTIFESPEIIAYLGLLASSTFPAPSMAPVTAGLPLGGGGSAQHIICQQR